MSYLLSKFHHFLILLSLLLLSQTIFANELASECEQLYQAQDVDAAYEVCRAAAEEGDAQAQYYLSVFYQIGIIVEPDRNESLKWLHAASEQGHAESTAAIAGILSNWMNTRHREYVDFFESNRFLRLAIQQGHVESQFVLARRYFLGHGITRNYTKAQMWLYISEASGYLTRDEQGNIPLIQHSLENVNMFRKLNSSLSTNQQLIALRMANKCIYSNFKEC